MTDPLVFRLPGYYGGEPSRPVPRDLGAVARRQAVLAPRLRGRRTPKPRPPSPGSEEAPAPRLRRDA